MTTESIVDKILSSFIDNKVTNKTFLGSVLMVNQIEIDDYQLLELYNEIVNSDLFDCKDASTKDGKDLFFIPNNKAKKIYDFYGSYSNFKNKKELTENDIIDFIFDTFRNQKEINIESFLRKNRIYLDDNQLDRIYEIIKSTNFVNDKSSINNSKRKIVFEFNGLGMRTLKNKKFSQYENEINKPNSLIITNSDLNNVNVNQGLLSNDSLIITQNTNNTSTQNETKQSKITKLKAILEKYWWGIFAPVIIGIIILIIEYKSGYFTSPTSLSATADSIIQPDSQKDSKATKSILSIFIIDKSFSASKPQFIIEQSELKKYITDIDENITQYALIKILADSRNQKVILSEIFEGSRQLSGIDENVVLEKKTEIFEQFNNTINLPSIEKISDIRGALELAQKICNQMIYKEFKIRIIIQSDMDDLQNTLNHLKSEVKPIPFPDNTEIFMINPNNANFRKMFPKYQKITIIPSFKVEYINKKVSTSK